MANITLTRDAGRYSPLGATFDITSMVAKRVGTYLNYYSFNTDGTMAVLHTQNGAIVSWDHYLPDGTILQTATSGSALQPFLDILYGRNPSSVRAFNYMMSGDDTIAGTAWRDTLDGRGGQDLLDAGTGNDRLLGGAGDDTLVGGGGADRMAGGAGADTFDFRALTDGGDTIADFQHGADHIRLSNSAFAFAFAEPLQDGVNVLAGPGTAVPANGNPALIYNSDTGVLSYDADGNGAGAAITIATLANHSAFSAADVILF